MAKAKGITVIKEYTVHCSTKKGYVDGHASLSEDEADNQVKFEKNIKKDGWGIVKKKWYCPACYTFRTESS